MNFCLKGSEERQNMIVASAELARHLRLLTQRTDPHHVAKKVELALTRIERMRELAEKREIIRSTDSRTLGRIYEQIAITIQELVKTVGVVAGETVAADKLVDLTRHCSAILSESR